MGRSWVGFQPAHRPIAGVTHVERRTIEVGISDGTLVALLTTADGLARWLGATTAFSARPGGNIDFTDDAGTYGGSFTVIDIPRRVTLVTERHGELDLALDARRRPTRLTASITRVIAEQEEPVPVVALLQGVLDALEVSCRGGAQAE